jgi:type II secretion system protein C
MLSVVSGSISMLLALLALASLGPEVTLSGVVLARSGRHAATLVSEGRARPVVAGDRAFGCEVSSILKDRVDLLCSGERRTLTLVAAAPKAEVRRPAEPGLDNAPAADVTMTRAELEARLDREMSRLMTETTLVPVTARGQVAGFTLSRIPAGTILDTLGLKAGDVLVSVNETPIDSFTTLVGLWPRLQTTGAVRAQILRDGKPVDISVNIR